jgi:hypothetical protein
MTTMPRRRSRDPRSGRRVASRRRDLVERCRLFVLVLVFVPVIRERRRRQRTGYADKCDAEQATPPTL